MVMCFVLQRDNKTVLDNMIWDITRKQLHSAARQMHRNKHKNANGKHIN